MKKLKLLFFAFALIVSATFISGGVSSLTGGGDAFSVQAQTSVKRKRKVGVTRRVYRGGKYVGQQIWNGSRWVAYKTYRGGKWVTNKSWRTGRKVVSRTKKIVY